MTTTDFFTHCWKNVLRTLRLPTTRELAAWLTCASLLIAIGTPARAEPPAVDLTQLRLERTEEGVFLSTSIKFDLPPVIEDALLKGIPMYFVVETTVFRDRWYWYDRKVASATRHMRLAYQPLTRRWRLTVSPTVILNSGLVLGQNFETQEEALGAIQRIYRWKIAEASEIEADATHNIDFKFRLDVSQLPRPFQIGAVGQADWNIAVSRNQRLVAESAR